MRKRSLFHLLVLTALAGVASAQWQAASEPLQPEKSTDRPRSGLPFHSGTIAPQASPGQAVPAGEAKGITLSGLDALLARSGSALRLHFCFAGKKTLTEDDVMQGAAIAEALALRAGNRPVLVSHGGSFLPGAFNVLIAPPEMLSAVLSQSELAAIRGGFVALKTVPAAGEAPVLVVTGRSMEDMGNAIISIGLVREKYPDAPYASIRQLVLPDAPPFFRRAPLSMDSAYTFQQLLDNGVTISQINGGVALELFLPGDFPPSSAAPVALQLHFSAGARGFGAGGGLALRVNGKETAPVRGKAIEKSFTTGSVANANLDAGLFQPGRNVVEISAASGGNIQVFADSSIVLPHSEYVPALPDLRITGRTFYPFIGQPDGSDLDVLLTANTPENIDSAFMLLARLAQSANTFFYAARISFTAFDPTKHLVIVGDYASLSPDFQKQVAVSAFDESVANVPLAQLNEAISGINLKRLLMRYADHEAAQPNAVSASGQKDDPAVFGYLSTAPPVAEKHGWVLLLSAFSPASLVERTQALVQPGIWDELRGDLVRWKQTPGSLEAHVPGGKPNILLSRDFVEMPMGRRINLNIWIVLVTGALLLFIALTSRMLGNADAMVEKRQRKI